MATSMEKNNKVFIFTFIFDLVSRMSLHMSPRLPPTHTSWHKSKSNHFFLRLVSLFLYIFCFTTIAAFFLVMDEGDDDVTEFLNDHWLTMIFIRGSDVEIDGPNKPKDMCACMRLECKWDFFLLFVCMQRVGSGGGEELNYMLGSPLLSEVSGHVLPFVPPPIPSNYTKTEMALSELMITYLSNFAHTG